MYFAIVEKEDNILAIIILKLRRHIISPES